MAEIRELNTVEEWESLRTREGEQKVLIIKHSTTCPISAAAWRAVQSFVSNDETDKADYVMVKVIESRPVSNQIAEDLHVRHQSPQAILLQNGEVAWQASHWDITEKALAKVLD